MILREIIKHYLHSKEIKVRLANKQVKVNNEVVTDLNMEIQVSLPGSLELGEFLYFNKDVMNWLTPDRRILFAIRDMFSQNLPVPDLEVLNNHTLISWSKHDEYVFKNEGINEE